MAHDPMLESAATDVARALRSFGHAERALATRADADPNNEETATLSKTATRVMGELASLMGELHRLAAKVASR